MVISKLDGLLSLDFVSVAPSGEKQSLHKVYSDASELYIDYMRSELHSGAVVRAVTTQQEGLSPESEPFWVELT